METQQVILALALQLAEVIVERDNCRVALAQLTAQVGAREVSEG